jgi:hypothetical protein
MAKREKQKPDSVKVIVIRQPWAWLIVNGYQDVENRSWKTRYRGRLLIQASANLPPKWKLEEGREFARQRGVKIPETLETAASSAWFTWTIVSPATGANGSRARSAGFSPSPENYPFFRLRGGLGIADPPRNVIRWLKRMGLIEY